MNKVLSTIQWFMWLIEEAYREKSRKNKFVRDELYMVTCRPPSNATIGSFSKHNATKKKTWCPSMDSPCHCYFFFDVALYLLKTCIDTNITALIPHTIVLPLLYSVAGTLLQYSENLFKRWGAEDMRNFSPDFVISSRLLTYREDKNDLNKTRN
jgi:hypothetical protein